MNNEPRVVVGGDIGGSRVAAGLVNVEGEILARNNTPDADQGCAIKRLAAISVLFVYPETKGVSSNKCKRGWGSPELNYMDFSYE